MYMNICVFLLYISQVMSSPYSHRSFRLHIIIVEKRTKHFYCFQILQFTWGPRNRPQVRNSVYFKGYFSIPVAATVDFMLTAPLLVDHAVTQ